MAQNERNLRQQAYEAIWKKIVHLEYKPLSVLSEKELSAELGIGLSPIRQALRRLEYDGLVLILSGRGTLTTEISLNAVQRELEDQACAGGSSGPARGASRYG